MARILIQWQNIGSFADKLLVFRETSPITSLDGLTPLAEIPPTWEHFLDDVDLGTWHYAIQPVLNGQLSGPFSTASRAVTQHELPQLVHHSQPVFWGSSWTGFNQLAVGRLPLCDPGDLLVVLGNTRTAVGTPIASEFSSGWNQVPEPAKANTQRPYMFWKYAVEADSQREISFDNAPGTTSGWTILHFKHSRQIKVAHVGSTGHTTGSPSTKPFAYTNGTGKAGLAICLREMNYAFTNAENYFTMPPAPAWSMYLGNDNMSYVQGGTAGTYPPEGDMRHGVVFRELAVGESFSMPFVFKADDSVANAGDLCALLYVD